MNDIGLLQLTTDKLSAMFVEYVLVTATVLLLVLFGLNWLLSRSSPATRHATWLLGVLGVAVIPYPNFTRQRWLGATHDLTSVWTGASVRPSGAVEIAVDAAVGDAVDYVNGGETNMFSLSSRMALRAGRHLDVRATHSLQHHSRHGTTVLAASVSELRSVYSFSQRAFIRGILQYRETERLELDGESANGTARRADVNLLFSYKVNPLTVFFLGYGGDWEDTGLGEVGRPLAPSGRALFIKLGYAWRP